MACNCNTVEEPKWLRFKSEVAVKGSISFELDFLMRNFPLMTRPTTYLFHLMCMSSLNLLKEPNIIYKKQSSHTGC